MGKESKASSLKPEQKVIVLRSVAQYLERCGFSKCFKKLLSVAEIEKKELNSSLPDVEEVFCEFFNKSVIEAVEVKESGDDKEDAKKKKKKAASVEETVSDEKEVAEVSAMEGVEKVKKEKKKKKKEEPKVEITKEEEEKVKEADAEIKDEVKEKKKKKKTKSKSSEAESLVVGDGKEKSSKKRKRSEPEEETKEVTEEEDVEESKRRKKEESVVEETPVKQADVQENGNVENSGKKSGKGLSNSKEPKKPFQRVNVEEIVFTDERLKDNSYWAKDGADSGYGAKAQEVLGQVRGRGFRHEKTKKKRGSYRGGEIDLQSHSVKFEYSDDE